MKLRNILYSLTLLMGVLTLGSCVNDDDTCLPEGKTQVFFSLVLHDNAKAATRAAGDTWGEPADPTDRTNGSDFDNTIDLNGLQILVFKTDGAFVGPLEDLVYSPKNVTSAIYENTEYEYVGTAPSDISNGDYKFVVLANCAKVSDITSLSDLNNLVFSLPDSGDPQAIPMWGVTKATLQLVAGARHNIGKIGLLRAMAKVSVKLTDPVIANKWTINKISINSYNKSGYTLPTGAETADKTEGLNVESCINVNASAATDRDFTAASGATELVFYLCDYDNLSTGATPAELTVTLTKTDGEGESVTTTDWTFGTKIEFRDYEEGKPKEGGNAYNIIRNHYYLFNITNVSEDAELYIVPTVEDWINGPELDYPINMSTSMRLFDSWLYRYDTDGNYNNWNESYMVVSDGRGAASTAEPIAGRPLYSPQIQLVTTGSGTFELYIDNSDFEIVRANKNEIGVVTSYDASNDEGKLAIASGEDLYTYFYIVPKEDVTPSDPIARVFLYYNDAAGKHEVPFNNNSLPGYSDDSSEIWAYYVSNTVYEDGKVGDNTFMRMYYQDTINPLVPVP